MSKEPLGALLLALEDHRGCFEVSVESPAGAACLSLLRGKLIDARFGDLHGLEAAQAVLGLKEGKYEVREVHGERAGPLSEDVTALLRKVGQSPELLRRKSTIAWGSNNSGASGGKTLRSLAGNPSAEATPPKQPSTRPPGRWGAPARKPLEGTGYSSIPPANLAEERVPAGRRRPITGTKEITPARRVETDPPPVDEIPVSRSSASSSPPAGLRAGALSARMTRQGSTPIRSNLNAHYEPDREIVSAARGQLSDSEIPVPSDRLDDEARSQLAALAEAIEQSQSKIAIPKDLLSSIDADKPPSSNTAPSRLRPAPPEEKTVPSVSIPKPDSTGDWEMPISSAAPSIPSPGSVPSPDTLPGHVQTGLGTLPVVGRYQVLSRLKRGGMGSVYMCRLSASAGFRRLFAMKVLHGHLCDQQMMLDAFFHEARVLGGLHHRNIVGIADVGSATEPYIVLDYVEGGSLSEIFRATRRKRRDPALIVSVMLDALSGLAEAHRATGEDGRDLGLVHCDVSPQNLLVGIDGTCRLTDFGAARTREMGAEKDAVLMGKPEYLAPERILKQGCDPRADLFSLGVVFYAGITGRDLFTGRDPEETMSNVLDQPIEPPSQVGWQPPQILDAIVLKALARDPAGRYQSAEEMAEDLRLVAGEAGLIASLNEVASWVTEVLRPTLDARRLASMRGATHSSGEPVGVDGEGNWATLPPPSVSAPDAPPPAATNPRPESPSATEITGPLEPPPSSLGFGEHTQMLTEPGMRPSRSRKRTLALYLLALVALLCIVWAVLRPKSVAPYFRMTSGGPDRASAVPDERPKPSPKSVDRDPDRIVIPDIGSSSDDP